VPAAGAAATEHLQQHQAQPGKSTQQHHKQPQVMKLREYQARMVFNSAALQQQTGWASLQTTKTAPILWA
jgi:hypothetical protein